MTRNHAMPERPDSTARGPFRFPARRHGKGELTYVGDVPVLRLVGTPEEAGEQLGVLSLRPATRLLTYPEDLLHRLFRSRWLARLLRRRAACVGRRLLARFPENARRELDSLIATGLDPDLVVLGNTLYDLKNISLPQVLGCSSVIVPPERSATGGPLFGRNLDFFGLGYLHEYSLVTVRPRTNSTLGYASVGFPGTLGCFSGMNEAGLALATHEVFGASGRRRYNPAGVPVTLVARRVLEECTCVAEATRLLREIERTTFLILVLCDQKGGRVLEITPDHVAELETDQHGVACSNHYRSSELANSRAPSEFIVERLTARLESVTRDQKGRRPPRAVRTRERLTTMEGALGAQFLGVPELTAVLDSVHQDDQTLQTMIFEPAARVMHVAFGPPPTSALSAVCIDLESFWAS